MKKHYERIVIVTPPDWLGKKYPIRHLSKIIIARPASITTGAVQLALEYDVDIFYLGNFAMPYGRIYSSKPGRLSDVKRSQVKKADSAIATEIAKRFVAGKISQQSKHLQSLAERLGLNFQAEAIGLDNNLHLLNLVAGEIKHARGQIFGIEGQAAETYFSALKKIVDFPGRNPAGSDIFNVMLNYGYGILYNEVERACLLTGLDPFIGFLHTDRYGKTSLVFDLVEEFRVPVVDSSLLPLFLESRVDHTDLTIFKDKKILTQRAKRLAIKQIFNRLHQNTLYSGRLMRLTTAIKNHVRDFAHYLIGKKRYYHPFDFNGY
ncbi:MAG TPA: CRISPR-associated endonuclease Cas1 [Patescibacteria group bacterium]|nr:CRISPR-associated endonuclease Cas1 [Patescibacteria group bacterium]